MKYCPQCGSEREYENTEDFCPVHRVRLVLKTTAPQSLESIPSEGETGGNGLFGRLKTMFPFGGKAVRDSENGGTDAILPRELVLQGWTLEDPKASTSTAWADFFRVRKSGGSETALFKRYRGGSSTSSSVYKILEGIEPVRLAHLRYSGNVKSAGSVFDSELLGMDDDAPFESYFSGNPEPAEGDVRWFLGEGLNILEELSSNGLSCSALDPFGLTLNASGEIRLSDFGRIYAREPFSRFVPGTADMNIEYAAPEIVTRRILDTRKSAMYSLGILVARMVWGYIPSQTAVLSGDLDFASLAKGLEVPLMGLLYPEPDQRWGETELKRWLDGDEPSVPDWSRLKPGASQRAVVFHGKAVYLPEDLAGMLYQDPDAGSDRLDEILDWLGENPRVRDTALEIRRHRASGRSRDWLVLRLAFRLNPRHPRSFLGISLDDDVLAVNLAELGRRAAAGDKDAMERVVRIHGSELNDVFGEVNHE